MSGEFRLLHVTLMFTSREKPGQEEVFPVWSRDWEYVTKDNITDGGKTCVAIFGPNQEKYLNTFLESNKYKIVYKSKKCVNPNYRDSGPRNTVVIFESKDKV